MVGHLTGKYLAASPYQSGAAQKTDMVGCIFKQQAGKGTTKQSGVSVWGPGHLEERSGPL